MCVRGGEALSSLAGTEWYYVANPLRMQPLGLRSVAWPGLAFQSCQGMALKGWRPGHARCRGGMQLAKSFLYECDIMYAPGLLLEHGGLPTLPTPCTGTYHAWLGHDRPAGRVHAAAGCKAQSHEWAAEGTTSSRVHRCVRLTQLVVPQQLTPLLNGSTCKQCALMAQSGLDNNLRCACRLYPEIAITP